jgi:hypothetical protein
MVLMIIIVGTVEQKEVPITQIFCAYANDK